MRDPHEPCRDRINELEAENTDLQQALHEAERERDNALAELVTKDVALKRLMSDRESDAGP